MLMPTVDVEPSRNGGAEREPRLPRPVWLALLTVATLAGEGIVQYHHPALEMIMTACDVGFPVVLSLILVAVILFGSEARQERAFRLLRWIRDKPEPPRPPEFPRLSAKSGAARGNSPRSPDRRPRRPP